MDRLEGSNGAALYSLRAGAVECDKNGLRVAGVALLARAPGCNKATSWQQVPFAELERDLQRVYEAPITVVKKVVGLKVVAQALNNGEIARAQIAAFLLKLPDPPRADRELGQKRDVLAKLRDGGWLEKGWNEEDHPRAGVAPNSGWFAPKDSGDTRSQTASTASVSESGTNPRQSEIVPICIAEGISIATDEYGNKLTTCHYACFGGGSFVRTFRGGGGCRPVVAPPFLN